MRDTGNIRGYHAHVYYDADSKPAAADLREAIGARFEVELGRWHDRPIGPHPRWSYQVAFDPGVFADLVPWLTLNRGGLIVFVHPSTGDHIADHTAHAIWLGEKVELDIEALR